MSQAVDADPAAAPTPPGVRRPPRARLIASVHPRHPFWGRVMALLAGLWRFIWWLWTSVIIGGLIVGAITSFATSGTSGLGDPRSWVIVRPLLAHPEISGIGLGLAALLTFAAYLSHRTIQGLPHGNLTAEYVLEHVDQLDPDQFVPRYVGEVYLARRDAATGGDAEAEVRAALRAAAARRAALPVGDPIGICVFGRPTEGKTRLAFEAMRETLPGWTLVKWPHNPQHPFDFAAQRGQSLVLWLDDLQEFSNPGEAPALADLPRRFTAAGARLVVVATCRDGGDERRARELLGGLLDRLAAVRPADIDRAEAGQLAQALAKLDPQIAREGVSAHMAEFDGTPGSVLLGVARMRDQRYPRLPEDAKRVLRALKVLRSARIYAYPAPRVRHTAVALFGLPDHPGAWRDAAAALATEGFVRLGPADADGERALSPVADVYLERAVPDYPAVGAAIEDDWPSLQATLARHRDADGLVSLGIAYNERPLGNLRANQEHAVACYRAALIVSTRETDPAAWAQIQNNLGNALGDLANLSEGSDRARLFDDAVAAYRTALTVRTREAAPAGWAQTQHNLGTTLADRARLAEGAERGALLGEAVAAYRAALTVYARAAAPADWATTQNNLGNALADQAELAEGAERGALLRQAVIALRAALVVRTREFTPADWAATQNNLGNALADQARLAEGAERAVLLGQAVAAFRAALEVYTREGTPADWAMTQNNLGNAIGDLGNLTEGSDQLRLFDEAVAAYRAALTVYTRAAAPADWAATQNNLGATLADRAGLAEGAERVALLGEAVAAFRAALAVYTREGVPASWATTQFNLALLYAQRAEDAADTATVCADLIEARHCVEGALTVFVEEYDPANHRNATRLRDALVAAMHEIGCPDVEPAEE